MIVQFKEEAEQEKIKAYTAPLERTIATLQQALAALQQTVAALTIKTAELEQKISDPMRQLQKKNVERVSSSPVSQVLPAPSLASSSSSSSLQS